MADFTLPNGTVITNIPEPVGAPAAPPSKPWADVGAEAQQSFRPSLRGYVRDQWNAFTHPLQTLDTVQDMAQGGLKRFYGDNPPAFVNRDASTEAFDATKQYFKDRFGSIESVKNTVATDPVGFAADLSIPLTMGGSALGRVPGVAGKIGKVVEGTGKAMDPASLAFETANLVTPPVAGFTTGAGATPIQEAQRVARTGTPSARADFKGNMRGTAAPTDVLADAQNNLQDIKTQRSQSYLDEMRKLGANNTALQFAPIEQAWILLKSSYQTPSGLSKASASTRRTLDDIESALAEWSSSPADHTVMGFDALKQRIQDLYPEAEAAGQGQRAVTRMVNAVKGVIEQQAPQYKSIMQNYESESRLIKETERALSLGDDASVDTAMRKLQSVTRNNVNTNYSQRQNLVSELEERGGRELMPSLAGQSLNAWSPRGLAPQLNASAQAGWAAFMNPKLLPFLAFNSPRAVGETTYAVNRMYSELAKAMGGATPGQATFQAGRQDERQRALAAALAGTK